MGLLTKGVRFLRAHGIGATYRAAARRFGPHPSNDKRRIGQALPYKFAYEPVRYRHDSAPPATGPASKIINWVIPNFYGASGGHRTIFRLTRALEEAGYEVHFHVFGETHYVSDSEATEALRRFYFPLKATVHVGVGEMRPSGVCMAGLVVEMNLPSLRAAYPDASPGIRLAPPTPGGIADALAEVLALDDSEMRREREGASSLVSELSWSEAERALVNFLGRGEGR